MKAKPTDLPFNTKIMPNVGKYHGSGMPAKYGTRPGTYTNSVVKKTKIPKASPPLKMN